jgi:hypothetical protein
MLRNRDVDRLKILDRLLSLENDTIDDLIEQALTVARMVEPKLDDVATYGPVERMIMQVQELQADVKQLKESVKMINIRMSSHGTTPTWPSNPGFTGPTMGSGTYSGPSITGTTGHPGITAFDVTTIIGSASDMSISPMTATQVNGLQEEYEPRNTDWESIKKYVEQMSQTTTKTDPKI